MQKKLNPKFVMYINVANLPNETIANYMERIINNINLKDTVYIATTKRETGIYKISEENKKSEYKYNNFDSWLKDYEKSEKFKKDGRGFAYPIVEDAWIAARKKLQ